MSDNIKNIYFDWLLNIVHEGMFHEGVSYIEVLRFLHDTPFVYSIERDRNRESNGLNLRYRFGIESNIEDAELYLDGPCSVLEMMVALALRCEETIMDDPNIGNRTRQWFWGMVTNLGLGSMRDGNFDKSSAVDVIERFLNRKYEFNGKGGLFTIPNIDTDLRDVEIWIQLLWYLDSIT